MKNLLSNKTLQATYVGDVMGGSVVLGMLGAFLFLGGRHYLGEHCRGLEEVDRGG
ncbi:hypothetical protein N9219_04480 [bacterium]|nr:hypothetical protein [bacterium]